MWFGENGSTSKDNQDKLYLEGLTSAVNNAGYKITRSNAEQYNNFIMDKIIGDIRLAPFIIADFTGNRGGVYFEAGFARGLGKEVIHTCHKDDFVPEKTHFDIQQINTIVWDKPEELYESLYHRIRATIGQGPHVFETTQQH